MSDRSRRAAFADLAGQYGEVRPRYPDGLVEGILL